MRGKPMDAAWPAQSRARPVQSQLRGEPVGASPGSLAGAATAVAAAPGSQRTSVWAFRFRTSFAPKFSEIA